MEEDQVQARADILRSESERAPAPVLCGAARAAALTAEHQHIADAVSAEARRRYCGVPAGVMAKLTPWPCYLVLEAHSQVVAGTNYFLKVRVSADGEPLECVQLRVFVSLFGDPPALAALRKGAAAAGALSYFAEEEGERST